MARIEPSPENARFSVSVTLHNLFQDSERARTYSTAQRTRDVPSVTHTTPFILEPCVAHCASTSSTLPTPMSSLVNLFSTFSGRQLLHDECLVRLLLHTETTFFSLVHNFVTALSAMFGLPQCWIWCSIKVCNRISPVTWPTPCSLSITRWTVTAAARLPASTMVVPNT